MALALIIPLIEVLIPAAATVLSQVLSLLLYFNVMLAIFNLVPVYPLDGSKILLALLPPDLAYEYEQVMTRFGTFILLALIIRWNGYSPIQQLISPVIAAVVSLLELLSAGVAGLF